MTIDLTLVHGERFGEGISYLWVSSLHHPFFNADLVVSETSKFDLRKKNCGCVTSM